MHFWRLRSGSRHLIATGLVLGAGLAFATSLPFAPSAQARSDFIDLSVKAAAESPRGTQKLRDVRFYMAGQKHPRVTQKLGTFPSNKSTNALGKSDESACQIAFLSAIIALQQRATKEGGNAVIDIKSITKHNDLVSATQFRCAAGNVIANVALEGTVAKLGK